MAKISASAKIYNSRGVAIDAKQKSKESSSIVNTILKAGSKIVCNNLNLYYNLTDKNPGRSLTGDYYLYDGKKIKDRYAVCVKNGSNENPVYMKIGYVNAKDIEV